ncbi:MAG: stage III sporulation protein AB [Firmicutes bacterium]|nr:stage III sporulation protein AB [Bacillota bacterium]
MIKGFTVVILGTGCTVAGLLQTWNLWERVRSIRDLRELLQLISTEILYGRCELKSIFIKGYQQGPVPLRFICQRVAESMSGERWDSFSLLWTDAWSSHFLKQKRWEERDVWFRMGRQLGHGGVEQQAQILKQCEKELERLEAAALVEFQTRGKMYGALGLCTGLFLAVLLV